MCRGRTQRAAATGGPGGVERALSPRMGRSTLGLAAAALGLTMVAAYWSRADTVTITDDDRNAPVQVTSTTFDGTNVSGTLINRGNDEVRDIRLLVDIAFLWNDETKPGDANPGRAVVFTVAGPLPAQGRLNFDLHPEPPLEDRTDGRYQPKARVIGYQTVIVGKAVGE